jgi:hypothetical protein
MNRCPAPEELCRLLDGPEGPEAEAFAAHLEGCGECQAALERLTGGPRPAPAPGQRPPRGRAEWLRAGPLPREAARLVEAVARAIQAAHERRRRGAPGADATGLA